MTINDTQINADLTTKNLKEENKILKEELKAIKTKIKFENILSKEQKSEKDIKEMSKFIAKQLKIKL